MFVGSHGMPIFFVSWIANLLFQHKFLCVNLICGYQRTWILKKITPTYLGLLYRGSSFDQTSSLHLGCVMVLLIIIFVIIIYQMQMPSCSLGIRRYTSWGDHNWLLHSHYRNHVGKFSLTPLKLWFSCLLDIAWRESTFFLAYFFACISGSPLGVDGCEMHNDSYQPIFVGCGTHDPNRVGGKSK